MIAPDMVEEDKIITVEDKPLEALQSEILTRVRDCAFAWAKGTGPFKKTKLLPTKVGRFWVGPTKSRLRV